MSSLRSLAAARGGIRCFLCFVKDFKCKKDAVSHATNALLFTTIQMTHMSTEMCLRQEPIKPPLDFLYAIRFLSLIVLGYGKLEIKH